MIRCKLEPVQNQHKLWTSEKGFRCYKLINPKTGEIFFDYYNVRQIEQSEGTVAKLLESPKGRYTIEVYYPQDATTDLDVLILRIVAKGWVVR